MGENGLFGFKELLHLMLNYSLEFCENRLLSFYRFFLSLNRIAYWKDFIVILKLLGLKIFLEAFSFKDLNIT